MAKITFSTFVSVLALGISAGWLANGATSDSYDKVSTLYVLSVSNIFMTYNQIELSPTLYELCVICVVSTYFNSDFSSG